MWASLSPWVDHNDIARLNKIHHTLPKSIRADSKKLIRTMRIYEQLLNNIRDSVIILTNIFSQKMNSDIGFYTFLRDNVFLIDDFAPVRKQTCNLVNDFNELQNSTRHGVERCINTFFTHVGFNRTYAERAAFQLLTSYGGEHSETADLAKFPEDVKRVIKDLTIRTDTIRNLVPSYRYTLDNCIDMALADCDKEALSLWTKAGEIFNVNQEKKHEDVKDAAKADTAVENDKTDKQDI